MKKQVSIFSFLLLFTLAFNTQNTLSTPLSTKIKTESKKIAATLYLHRKKIILSSLVAGAVIAATIFGYKKYTAQAKNIEQHPKNVEENSIISVEENTDSTNEAPSDLPTEEAVAEIKYYDEEEVVKLNKAEETFFNGLRYAAQIADQGAEKIGQAFTIVRGFFETLKENYDTNKARESKK